MTLRSLFFYSDEELKELDWHQTGPYFILQGQRFTVVEATSEGIWLYKVD